MIEAVTIMSVANMAKAVVKSSHEMGTLVFRLVNSRMWMRSVIKQQKHQQNMHQDQWDRAKFVKPADATNAKQVHVRTNSDIRTMPTGEISALISKRTIVNQLKFLRYLCNVFDLFKQHYILLSVFIEFHCSVIHVNKPTCPTRKAMALTEFLLVVS